MADDLPKDLPQSVADQLRVLLPLLVRKHAQEEVFRTGKLFVYVIFGLASAVFITLGYFGFDAVLEFAFRNSIEEQKVKFDKKLNNELSSIRRLANAEIERVIDQAIVASTYAGKAEAVAKEAADLARSAKLEAEKARKAAEESRAKAAEFEIESAKLLKLVEETSETTIQKTRGVEQRIAEAEGRIAEALKKAKTASQNVDAASQKYQKDLVRVARLASKVDRNLNAVLGELTLAKDQALAITSEEIKMLSNDLKEVIRDVGDLNTEIEEVQDLWAEPFRNSEFAVHVLYDTTGKYRADRVVVVRIMKSKGFLVHPTQRKGLSKIIMEDYYTKYFAPEDSNFARNKEAVIFSPKAQNIANYVHGLLKQIEIDAAMLTRQKELGRGDTTAPFEKQLAIYLPQ